MKRKNSILGGIVLCFATLHGADVPPIPVVAPDAETGAQIPADNYYSSANLTRLTAEGKRKHAPLAIIIDQDDIERPANNGGALTKNFAQILQTAFVPTIVSRSIAYNYFVRRNRADKAKDPVFMPENNPVDFDQWHAYNLCDSQFFLFVPNHYIQNYKNNLGLNLNRLKDITGLLPSAPGLETNIIQYVIRLKIASLDSPPFSLDSPPFSIENLRTILTTTSSGNKQPTKAELEQQNKLPIWDIILHGHGSAGGSIGGLPPEKIQELLNFFNNELPVGLFYIRSCCSGGENLNLLEFDTAVSNKVLRNLNYIVIVSSITDRSTWFTCKGQTNELFYKLYSNAARLQGKGESLDTLLNDLSDLYRHPDSPHGSSNIPQVWLPGGLGFQTYKINEKVQILGNVKIKKHEDEKSQIVLPNSSMVALIYAKSINIPLKVWPHEIRMKGSYTYINVHDEVYRLRKEWGQVRNVAELLSYYSPYDLKNTVTQRPSSYPGLIHILAKLPSVPILTKQTSEWEKLSLKRAFQEVADNAVMLLYPEFISMLRGNLTTQYFNKIELEPPVGKERELTGVMHFIRDAFFDIEDRSTTKTFLIEELIGNNDISALLELSRLANNVAYPQPLEAKLGNSIGKQIRLKKVIITTDEDNAHLDFIFGDTAWSFSFKPTKQMTSYLWNFKQTDAGSHYHDFIKKNPRPEKIDQKPISEILGQAPSIACARQLQEQEEAEEEARQQRDKEQSLQSLQRMIEELKEERARKQHKKQQMEADEAEARKIAELLGPEWE